MNHAIAGHVGPEAERAQVEGVLGRYPNIDPSETQELVRWFREASALDVAMVASNEGIRDAYAQFRRDHVDRFKLRDIALAIGFAVLCALVVAGIVYLGS